MKHSRIVFLPFLTLLLLGAGCQEVKQDVKQVGKDVKEVAKDTSSLAQKALNKGDELADLAKDAAKTAKTASEKVAGVLGDLESPLLTLEDFTGGESTGTVGRKMVDDVFTLALFADVPSPETGKHYEAWLVRPSDGYFVNIGTLETEVTGHYFLTYTSATNYMDYKKVKVTRETDGGDEFAEETILTGEFE